MRENRIKRQLQAGQTAIAVSGHHNADMIDFLGQFGFDGVWLEGEHGPVDWDAIGDLSRACDLWGMASVTRVNNNDPGTIMRALDRGTMGIVVPHVNTREAAEQAMKSAKFAPVGYRGMFGGRQSFGVPDYLQRANDQTLVVVLIEEIEAVNNLADILTVDNIDVFFVAPSDLAQSMGLIGQIDHPKVKQTISDAVSRIAESGRTAGAIAWANTAEEVVEAGARFLMTSWLPYLSAGAKTYLKAVRRAADRS